MAPIYKYMIKFTNCKLLSQKPHNTQTNNTQSEGPGPLALRVIYIYSSYNNFTNISIA